MIKETYIFWVTKSDYVATGLAKGDTVDGVFEGSFGIEGGSVGVTLNATSKTITLR